MKKADELPIIAFEGQHAWEAWLNEHHAEKGVWLKFSKKGSGIASVTYAEALEVALCYGWIDAQKASFDEQYWLQKFTRRGPKSIWSKVNREKATTLIEQGRMQPAGLQHIESAKADGRWEASYDSQRTMTVPPDFQHALDNNSAASEFFATLSSANRYSFLFRIQTARKPETRATRIQKFIEMLAQHQTFHPQ